MYVCMYIEKSFCVLKQFENFYFTYKLQRIGKLIRLVGYTI